MKKLYIVLLSFLLAVLSTAAWTAHHEQPKADLKIVTGEHWMGASVKEKRAFLFGIGNMLEIEQAMAGDNYEAMRGRSIVPVLLEGLAGTSIADIVMQLDKYYADNPDQISRPVIEVLYIEMALPGLKT